ncbi:CDP-alcohol phosphatidyltransferase family protein [Sphingomonas quercus]|uniref:CDP-alcohol phosphatidyltransferase family protein n=1 Tax=Sphingomonas quercus TaxID=2842451 RepID=A0ABS6BJ42_9SPHN|nr:CDP-alcohol phosphatidyltransferase family protein [Sphingomonas quercus]MBU3078320.1 CDP-alcohol phosphatidyltransferase family protein [Sphingomonas quercus]
MNDASAGVKTAFVTEGANQVTIYGLSPVERMRRFAVKAGLAPVERMPATGPAIVADLGFAWDPAWLAWVKKAPGRAMAYGGRVVLAHYPDAAGRTGLDDIRDGERDASLYNETLRKREDAYVLPLTEENRRRIEKASYDGAYKGVTDLLTLYLWRGAAFHLTRLAAMLRLSPNMVSLIGIALCVWAFFLFRDGRYWEGLAAGLVFMVLDTVDGKLARCTGTSSSIGNIIDHGVDLVHPPFWYWAWGAGLGAWGQAMSPAELWSVVAILVAGYAVQRLVEGAFIASFRGIHIHVWERIDSRFRLITARRNPNMVILFASLLAGEPRLGLLGVVWWTVISCVFHVVRLIQAYVRRASGHPVTSWLAD